MAIRIETCHFVSIAAATSYYRNSEPSMAQAVRTVSRKFAAGEISIGRPSLKLGEKLVVIDEGRRYAIEGRET